MAKINPEETKLSRILAKSVEPFMETASRMVQDDICERCPARQDDCYPCQMSQQYFDIAMSGLIAMVTQWN